MGGKCDERARLKRLLLQAMKDHRDVVAVLTCVARTGDTDGFLLAFSQTRAAKALAQLTGDAYWDHIREHRCGRSWVNL